jgi:hypothetical protein
MLYLDASTEYEYSVYCMLYSLYCAHTVLTLYSLYLDASTEQHVPRLSHEDTPHRQIMVARLLV